ncbi:MAG: cobalamin B12-binding domain-containing protein [Planctomycetaceae bacterium]|nr:cobalamin-dependent protein [Planctomycetales bacterium]MCB9921876.1 cobalamin B12-binding domain-containing protein [Planctomycetaceae bacterium]
MRDLVTPKQLARAIDVSESSVKRWCDQGVIDTQYTAGGHRRISIAGVLEFIRRGKYELVHPEALDLPPTSGQTVRVVQRAREQLTAALIAGNERLCRQIAIDLYLAEHSLSVICDDVFAAAFQQIGERWACGEAEVYQERRGCEITLRVLHELRSILPQLPDSAPLAIGGAASGDQYSLGTTMAELVLRDAKWNAVSLGDNLPFETISAAIRTHRPKLFWLSCSYIVEQKEFLASYSELYEEYGMDVAFVVGGFALTDEIRRQMKYSAFCDNMQHLEGFAQTLLSASEK